MKNEILIPPKVFINEVNPTLRDENRIYASEIKARLTDKIILNVLENKGIEVEEYVAQEAECLFEISDAEFLLPPPPDSEEQTDPNFVEFKYLGYRSSCDFFPIPDTVKKEDGKIDKQLYRALIEEQFAQYGETGFGLKPFERQPVMKSANGYSFIVNKYLYRDLLKGTRKGTWFMAKVNKVELLSIAKPPKREHEPILADRVEEQQQYAEAMKVPKRKRFGVF